MTSALVSSIETRTFTSADRLFFDSNIWLTLEPAQFTRPGPSEAIYSQAFKRILQAKSKIFVDVVVLSEVVNRWLRYAWQASNQTAYPDFKAFRKGPDCRRAAKDIVSACERLLRYAERTDTKLRSIPIDELLTDLQKGTRDFNDGVIAATCDANRSTLVTHDGDFRGSRANILTANSRLLTR